MLIGHRECEAREEGGESRPKPQSQSFESDEVDELRDMGMGFASAGVELLTCAKAMPPRSEAERELGVELG